jgi:hypothetical protein
MLADECANNIRIVKPKQLENNAGNDLRSYTINILLCTFEFSIQSSPSSKRTTIDLMEMSEVSWIAFVINQPNIRSMNLKILSRLEKSHIRFSGFRLDAD